MTTHGYSICLRGEENVRLRVVMDAKFCDYKNHLIVKVLLNGGQKMLCPHSNHSNLRKLPSLGKGSSQIC